MTVDGATKPVTATGAVADALNAVTLGTHDEVTPDLSTALTDDLAITIVRVEIRTIADRLTGDRRDHRDLGSRRLRPTVR